MRMDYSRLNCRIEERFRSKRNFAKHMGWSTRHLSMKLEGKTEWRKQTILRAIKLLGLNVNDIPEYFFTPMEEESE